MKKAVKVARRAILGLLLTSAIGFVSVLAISAYQTHVPVEATGRCIIFDLNPVMEKFDENEPQLALGTILENHFKDGSALVGVNLGPFQIPIEVPYRTLRKFGYIRTKCL